MADDFTERYGNLLIGSYNCVDRVVLNAFFPVGHNPGGFRCWWRRLNGSDDQLDDTHLTRVAGRVRPAGQGLGGRERRAACLCKAGSVST